MPLTCNGETISDISAKSVANAMGKNSQILQSMPQSYSPRDVETISIQPREAVFFESEAVSPIGSPIKSVYSPGYVSCALLVVSSTPAGERYVAHVDYSTHVDFSKIVNLFARKKQLFVQVVHVDLKTLQEGAETYIDKTFNYTIKNSKQLLIEDANKTLANIATSISAFLQDNSTCLIEMAVLKYSSRETFSQISLMYSVEHKNIFPWKGKGQDLTGKYYPPVDNHKLLNAEEQFHLVRFYAHSCYLNIYHLINKELLLIYDSHNSINPDKSPEYLLTHGNAEIYQLLNRPTFDVLVPELVDLNERLCGETTLSKGFIEELKSSIENVQTQGWYPYVRINITAEANPHYEQLTINEKEGALLRSTTNFFKMSSSNLWQPYPTKQLPPQYAGHQIRFFRPAPDKLNQAKIFVEGLKTCGFDARITGKNTKQGPAIVVDLTNSKLKR